MNWIRMKYAGAAVAACMLLLPVAALAQTGAIAGSVADETGGVLPGVTVEAASPALIEGVRATVTDGAGLYTIEALRPGAYTVTFTLPGFNTFVRDGIELVSDFTANVDGTMTVGSIEETVTVSGASPVIDVQNVVSQQNLSREQLDTLPTSRTYFGLAALTPGMTQQLAGGGHDVGGTAGDAWGYVQFHGSSDADGVVMWDGMSINNNIGLGGGSSKQFFLNQAAVEEMVISTSDMNAEYPYGGVATNAIPKEGANTFSFYVNVSGTNGDLQQNNVNADLERRLAQPGFATQGTRKEKIGVDKIWDYGVGFGGPLVRDRVWFYTAHRWWGSQNEQYRSFGNVADGYASDPGATGYGALYRADLTNPSVLDLWNRDNSVRFTIQASERNKITLSQAFQDNCACNYWTQWGLSDPAAAINYTYGPINLTQASWTMPANNRLLFEAGVSLLKNNTAPEFPDIVRQDADALASTGMTMQQFMGVDLGTALQHVDVGHHSYVPFYNWRSYASAIPGREDCGPCLGGTGHDMPTQVFRGSMSYVSGSHNFKVGVNGRWATEQHAQSRLASNAWPIRLLFFGLNPATGRPVSNNGVVGYISQYATPKASLQESFDLGFYAQDQWAIDRLTLNLGVRYDRINGWVPAQTAPEGRWTARNPDGTPLGTGRIDNLPNYQDITPRLGVAYDLRGDGRTAIKASLGKYVVPVGSAVAEAVNPLENVRAFTNRLWFDFNDDLIPSCDLDNFGDQTGFLGGSPGGECGPILHPQFGTTQNTLSFEPGALEGWGKRQYQWQTSVSIQHELTDIWSVEAGWYRTQYGNFLVGDDLNVTPADFVEFSIAAPPGSEALGLTSGERITGLYTKSAEALTRPENYLVQAADNFGDMFQRYNGFDVNFNGRFDNGLLLAGGISTGSRTFGECFVVDSPIRERPGFCEQTEPWGALTQLKLNGSVPLPYDTQVSFVFQSLGGLPWISQYRAGGSPTDQVMINGQLAAIPSGTETILLAPSGRGVNSLNTNSLNKVPYGTQFYFEASDLYEPRLNQLDLRFTKIFNFGGARIRGWVDLFNVFNVNQVTALSGSFNPVNYPVATSVMGGRMLKLGAQFDF